MAGENWTVAEDGKTATLTFPTSPPVNLNVSATLVEHMLRDLGNLRWEMVPEAPDTFDSVEDPVPDPVYEIEPDESSRDNIILHIRDPRYGWLHYAIPKEEARKLAGYLQEML